MSDDPFSDLLTLTNAQSVISGGFTIGGDWSIRFRPERIKFYAVLKGRCLLDVEGAAGPVRLEAGDTFLVSGRPFLLASDLAIEPREAKPLFAGWAGKMTRLSEIEEVELIGGHAGLDPVRGALLMDVLPPFIHARAGGAQATVLQWLVGQIVSEQMSDLPGVAVASTQLAQLMLVQLLRVHLEDGGRLAAGLLRAVSDRRIAPALRLMHADPGRAWQLGELAAATAMSRTTFAVYFKSVAGVAPLAYLTEWRMRLAEKLLREENLPVSTLARSLGYTSESAFSNAFKRITGRAPKFYRSEMRAVAEAAE
ncbi:AraC family transcriptional regulator [Rhizobium sp. Root1220]|uniref:AraC family transcriptional regulator n=1 Tax=Rhizobium sp. Root1220 TaxID=1736432 RepID=UPI000701CEFD|nr:AraC family transcriptional regulator [Rhizobium sp. Root1220]KQV63793.1 AraC family transcriptional regulator [Rhizobium sp. Root1220]